MAHQIDHAALWLFCTISAFFLGMTLTQNAVLPASIFAFAVILLLHFAVHQIPDKRFIRRSERLNSIRALLKKWALQEPDHAFQEICSLLPDFLSPEERKHSLLVQRLPDEGAICSNELLELWHAHRASNELIILSTCPAGIRAYTLAKELTEPSVRLIDSTALTRHLMDIVDSLPADNIKRKQRKPFTVCVAQLLYNIRIKQVCLYLAVFFFLYLSTHSSLYLLAIIAFAALLCLSSYARHRISSK